MYFPGEDKDAMRHDRTDEAVRQPQTQDHADARLPAPVTRSRAAADSRAVAVSTLAVAACGGGVSGGSSTGGGPPPVSTVRKPQTDGEAARFLLQTSLSASTGAITQLRSEGYEPWLDRQISNANDQTARTFLAERGFDRVDANRFYNGAITGDYMIWSQLLSGGNSVRKRIAFALSEFFVVSLSSINLTWRGPAIGEYWDILNRHVFGNFRDLLQDITLNPAMGVFLNTRGNRAADPRTGRVPDENYAREVMQLFTIGLFELNSDGTNRLAGGNPVESYTSDDVTGLAKVSPVMTLTWPASPSPPRSAGHGRSRIPNTPAGR